MDVNGAYARRRIKKVLEGNNSDMSESLDFLEISAIMKLRNDIQRLRKSKGITLEALAELAKVGRSTISDIERDAHIPGIDVALKIARALNRSVDELFWLEKQNSGGTRDGRRQ